MILNVYQQQVDIIQSSSYQKTTQTVAVEH